MQPATTLVKAQHISCQYIASPSTVILPAHTRCSARQWIWSPASRSARCCVPSTSPSATPRCVHVHPPHTARWSCLRGSYPVAYYCICMSSIEVTSSTAQVHVSAAAVVPSVSGAVRTAAERTVLLSFAPRMAVVTLSGCAPVGVADIPACSALHRHRSISHTKLGWDELA